MHLRSISMKGFKSFPHRTKLEFGPGVSVVVGPNGSGKSNITDAVLWALGEQSPLAVRGQSMKDVIFAGAHGVQGARAAEVEVVIDNHDGALPIDFSEISIVRKLGRDGEGEYRLNGARCRLVDVVEVLSDSGLGKEMHSVVSQGKVEQIVLSRPRDRRLMIEEAAGLGKHRKRRRRAQLKLERTEENLSRSLDVEREARSRLRPLKQQAEAAELHERLERQTLEARYSLSRDAARSGRLALAEAEERARLVRTERDEAERLLSEVARRREEAEEAFAAQTRDRERLQARLYAARSASERIAMRLERVREQAGAAQERRERRLRQVELLEQQAAADAELSGEEERPQERITALESELAELDAGREERLARELEGLESELAQARERVGELQSEAAERRGALDAAEQAADAARTARSEAERAAEAARTRAAQAGAELASVNQFVRGAGQAPGDAQPLAERLHVEKGYELALAAVLGPRLTAAVVDDRTEGERVLDAAGPNGGSVLLTTPTRAGAVPASPSVPTGQPLAQLVRPERDVAALAERLLDGVWVVESLSALTETFSGVAVTKAGRLFDARTGELSQAPAGGAERLLEELGRRDELIAASEDAVREEIEARAAVERHGTAVAEADAAREAAESALRGALRAVAEAEEVASRAEWLIARRRETPQDGPEAVRRAELLGDLRAEQRLAERIERERQERTRALVALKTGAERDLALAAEAERAGTALESAHAAVSARRDALGRELEEGAAAGDETAAALKACAQEEAELHGRLKRASEAVTGAEVAAQQVRDAAADAERELNELAGKLGLEPEPAAEALPEEEREALGERVARLMRRREQLGPVNPLAKREYEEAVAHVEELETQRADLESALAELEGLIKETDRRIREAFEQTFEAAARNFEDVVQHLFPGGRGALRLVQEEMGPRPVVGGDAPEPAEGEEEEQPEAGVEIEVTPPGKSTKRLSLLSGGEKSLVALAFMFAVFLARPCPFYILDEVEAALDDLNIDRFLQLVKRYSDRAQFIVVTHQKRTMDAADTLYGVSMGGDGISRVVSRKLAGRPAEEHALSSAEEAAA
ncbi:MAG: chromosome segregation protein [Thermoleophilaceae bacterium]|nr:chromosome segregation protein [Thermoleophilaceae bacterium]